MKASENCVLKILNILYEKEFKLIMSVKRLWTGNNYEHPTNGWDIFICVNLLILTEQCPMVDHKSTMWPTGRFVITVVKLYKTAFSGATEWVVTWTDLW